MTDNRLRIIFMGTPDFAVPPLQALHQSGHEIICVYSQPPRPKGRGQAVMLSPVHHYAERHGIPVFHPQSLKSPEEQEIFENHKPDLAIVAAYGLILPKAILDAPKYGCINIHASLLPRWRGASPIQQAIWRGDSQTGICLMQMEAGLDTGPVIAERRMTIAPRATAADLHDDLSAMGAAMIVEAADRIAQEGRLPAQPQEDAHATYAPLLKKEDGRIDWNQNAEDIDRQIRALNPWPGVWTSRGDTRIKILEARPAPEFQYAGTNGHNNGQILSREGHVACGNSTTLKILKIQPGSAKPMDFASAVNGGHVKVGDFFQ